MNTLNPDFGFSVKKAFLGMLVVSVLLSALMGIAAVLSQKFGVLQVKVLLTTATISAASLCGLACGAHLTTQRGQALPLAGIGLAGVAAAMIILEVWLEFAGEPYWKAAAISSIFAVACAHLSLLSMARLADWFQWSLVAAYVVIFGVASLISLIILGEPRGTGVFRLLAVAAIIDAAITILIPIFHRMSRSDAAATPPPQDEREALDAEIRSLTARLAELKQQRARLA